MAPGHEKPDVHRLEAMLGRLGKRGYAVQEASLAYGIDADFDGGIAFNPDSTSLSRVREAYPGI